MASKKALLKGQYCNKNAASLANALNHYLLVTIQHSTLYINAPIEDASTVDVNQCQPSQLASIGVKSLAYTEWVTTILPE
jgi:hypothetical protein